MSIIDAPGANIRKRLRLAALAILLMIAVGSAGFYVLEDWALLQSIYVATQTVTTVGYGDHTPVSAAGRAFAVLFMLAGAGTVLYALSVLAQAVVQTEVLEVLGRRRRLKEMEKLSDHFIVCGAGRVGIRIIRSLRRQGLKFVVIESDERKIADLSESGTLVLAGDATDEADLIAAGVERARALATCLPDDAANVYTVLTARGLNPSLHIVARAVEEQAEDKLIRVGANRVVAPTIIGSRSMARALLNPALADLMDSIAAETLDLVFEEIAVDERSPLAGKRLDQTIFFNNDAAIVVAVRRGGGEMLFHPRGDLLLDDGDLLVVLGQAPAVKELIEAGR
ncbi:MAG: potassium channel family protein [Pyrinomonadaceae bacterium]